MPPPSAPSTSASGRFKSAAYRVCGGLAVGSDHPNTPFLEQIDRAGEVGHARHRNEFGGARRHLAHHPVHRGRAVLGDEHRMRARGIGRAQTGAQIVRIGDPIEDQQQGIPGRLT